MLVVLYCHLYGGCATISIIRLSVAYYVANIELFGLKFSILGVSFRLNFLGKFQ